MMEVKKCCTESIFSEIICYLSFTMLLSFLELKLSSIVIPLSTLQKSHLTIIVMTIVTAVILLIVAAPGRKFNKTVGICFMMRSLKSLLKCLTIKS